ncbi:MAG: GNAT family N-acetyltransferase [Nocardioidaceae bacterium]
MIIEPAGIADLPTIIAMRDEASAWLHERGIEQWREPWPNHDAMVDRIAASIQAGETWMTRKEDGATTGTVALDTHADPRLWTPDEREEPTLYLHRLMIRRRWAGLGAHVLDWAVAKAGYQGNDWVRVDVWTHNEPLHKYYLRHGFEHVRTRDRDDYPSGALFQRHADRTARHPRPGHPVDRAASTLPD